MCDLQPIRKKVKQTSLLSETRKRCPSMSEDRSSQEPEPEEELEAELLVDTSTSSFRTTGSTVDETITPCLVREEKINVEDVVVKGCGVHPMDSHEDVDSQTKRSQSNIDLVLESPQLDSQVLDLKEEEEEETEVINEALNRIPGCLLPLPRLQPDSNHLILFRVPLKRGEVPSAYPRHFADTWPSEGHVMMPCSSRNQILFVEEIDGEKVTKRLSKWKLIETQLLGKDLNAVEDLIKSIITYTPNLEEKDFEGLATFFNEFMNEEERRRFFQKLLPRIIDLALKLPSLVTRPVPLLKNRMNSKLFLSQQQISSLLANAFLCTFPKRNFTESRNLPDINFKGLFRKSTTSRGSEAPKYGKLKCLLNYFSRVTELTPKGVVSFERRCLLEKEKPHWADSNQCLRRLQVMSSGFIEREGRGMLQVDFANKLVGGGVLDSGCVQEEIRFVLNPELIVSRLFTEKLWDSEVLFINGTEQFNQYSGYADSFRWDGDCKDTIEYDEWGRKCTNVVAMDAMYFSYALRSSQYNKKAVDRELNKAFCAFMERRYCDPRHRSAIASGNWGCGVYNGDPMLKATLQLMAASQCDRELVYFTFRDKQLKADLEQFYDNLILNDFTVGSLYETVLSYGQYLNSQCDKTRLNFFQFVSNRPD